MLRLGLNQARSIATTERRYAPGRGLLYSVLVHEIALVAISFLSISGVTAEWRAPEKITWIDLKAPVEVLYLPILTEGEGQSRDELESDLKPFTYPGQQPIVSDFPEPTNRLQTFLRPELRNPLTLPLNLSLPNFVRITEPGLVPEFELQPAPPKPIEPTVVETAEPVLPDPPIKQPEPLLALSPTPSPREEVVEIPPGEVRAKFAISPDPNLPAPSGAGTEPVAGNSPGNNPFPGITILGGVPEARAGGNAPSPGKPLPAQMSWGFSILSTEAGGGGLPPFGVFGNEQISTVYLDMRKTTGDPAVSWIFEFAPLPNSNRSQRLVLPFPIVKELPVLPDELIRKYLRRVVIVYCIVNTDGKMEQMSVKESPDPLLNGSVLDALSKWVFRPAQVGSDKVPMKLLLGVPVS